MFRNGLRQERANDWVSCIARLQPWYLLVRYPHRLAKAAFVLTSAAIAVGIISAAAICTGQPLIFPSLGPSAFLFLTQPTAPSSCPRNAILSHGLAVLVGWFSYWLFAHVMPFEALSAQVGAATLSLGLISGLMVAAKIAHAPAASTTLIVAMGLMVGWQQLAAVMVAVVLLTAVCYIVNRLSGIVYPLWPTACDQQREGLVFAALQTAGADPRKDPYADIADRITARQELPKSGVN
jgi:CBS-domain-containing membrane protein